MEVRFSPGAETVIASVQQMEVLSYKAGRSIKPAIITSLGSFLQEMWVLVGPAQ